MRFCASRLLLLVLAAGVRESQSDEVTRWILGLRFLLKNCPTVPWNGSDRWECLVALKQCMQQHLLVALDALLTDDVIPVVDGISLVRHEEIGSNSTNNKFDGDRTNDITENDGRKEGMDWRGEILNRLTRIFRTHVLKIDVGQLSSTVGLSTSSAGGDTSDNVVQGRRRHRKRHHMLPIMMMGFMLMGTVLIPMGFQFLAVLGGKALILAKMALMLSSIQGLKKIATNGVNYGLYHSPVSDGWHDRSHQEQNAHFEHPYQGYSSL